MKMRNINKIYKTCTCSKKNQYTELIRLRQKNKNKASCLLRYFSLSIFVASLIMHFFIWLLFYYQIQKSNKLVSLTFYFKTSSSIYCGCNNTVWWDDSTFFIWFTIITAVWGDPDLQCGLEQKWGGKPCNHTNMRVHAHECTPPSTHTRACTHAHAKIFFNVEKRGKNERKCGDQL